MERANVDDLVCDDAGDWRLNGMPFTGVAVEYFADKSVRSEQAFVGGQLLGVSKSWYPDGQPEFEAEFLRELLHGKKTEWHPNGQIKSLGVWELGVCKRMSEWDSRGVVIREYQIDPHGEPWRLLERQRQFKALADQTQKKVSPTNGTS